MSASPGVSRRGLVTLPHVDVTPFVQGGSFAARKRVAAELRQACIDIGFFYLHGHGLDPGELEAALQWTRRFFALPFATKMRYRSTKEPARDGFVQTGGEGEYGGVPDLKERFSIGREPIAGEPAEGSYNPGENQWPGQDVLPGFADFMRAYCRKQVALAQALVRTFALSLDVEEHFFDAMYRYLGGRMLLNYYPPVDAAMAKANRRSFSPHTDYGAFTLLLQDDAGGLQARNALGDWIDVPPQAGTLVVNIGDMMAMWTNDLYTSSLHRAQNVKGDARVSIPFFTYPHGSTLIRCIDTCRSSERPARYQPVIAQEYNRALIARAFKSGLPGISTRTAERVSEDTV
jgi:isopenicillin N synthase-like dioxygenase